MTRRMQPSHERLMFPAWSGSAEGLADDHNLSRRRRRDYRVWARRIGFIACIMMMIWAVKRKSPGSDAALSNVLSESELKDLGMARFQRRHVLSGNPWRGAGRRAREDIVMSISGCGGKFRKSITVGDTVSVRYSIRSIDGKLLDSSKGSGDVLTGSGQVDAELEKKLQGLCAGEAVRFRTKDGRKVVLYIERVGMRVKNGKALEDRLARMVKTVGGHKGRSCTSTCQKAGLVCEEKGLVVVNNCPRLRETFGCMKCEIAAAGSSGADMPALVARSAPVGHARGACLVTPQVRSSSCDAKYAYTRRLCPCFEEHAVRSILATDK